MTQTIVVHSYSYPSTPTATLRSLTNDSLVATAISVVETSVGSGVYNVTFTGSIIAAGTYRLRVTVAGVSFNLFVTLKGQNNEQAIAREPYATEVTGSGALTTEQADQLASIADVQAAVLAMTGVISTAFASIEWEGTIVGVPVSFVAGADLTFSVQLLDVNGSPLSTVYGIPVASATWLFGIGTERNPRTIAGVATWAAGVISVVVPRANSDNKPAGAYEWQLGVLVASEAYWIRSGAITLRPRQFVIPTTTTAAP